MRHLGILLTALAAAFSAAAGAAPAPFALDPADFRDRVYACWLGKSIGGTLGMPVEGQREMHAFTFFNPVPETPAANDDLDLQLLWLKALEERGSRLDARVLGEYWLSYVPVDWNEYGIGKANMRQGFAPPLSGHYRNKWRDSNGAWIRSEIWACVAPGAPALAARYAFEDACVDHGTAEGTWAEVFTAVVQSAAFVEKDRDRLLALGLAAIPPDCATARSIRTAIDAHRRGLDWRAARQAVVEASQSTGWFMAPQNVAFVVLGWLYGDGDFGKSICTAVNCGDDTDCTGATLGALLGILDGTRGIPDRWRKPVGNTIRNVAIAGFPAPATLDELTDRTVRMAQLVLLENNAPVAIRTPGPAQNTAPALDVTPVKALWTRSPYHIPCDLIGVRAILDLMKDPEAEPGVPRPLRLLLENTTPHPVRVAVTWRVPGRLVAGKPATTLEVPPQGAPPTECAVSLQVDEATGAVLRGSVEVAPVGRVLAGVIPFALATPVRVSRDDLALARLGATATADSEYDREPGCTAKLIDGVICGPDDFEGQRWHSALTPHPHWVAIRLPAPRTLGRVILHFADPLGHPVAFTGEVSRDGKTWTPVFEERACTNPRRYEKAFQPVEAQHFRLTIRRSASPKWPDAAQLSEIELLPR